MARQTRDRARYEERKKRRELDASVAQAARLAHKEAAKEREVVDCRMRLIMADRREAIEIEFSCTRAELRALQREHTVGTLMINWIQEDKL